MNSMNQMNIKHHSNSGTDRRPAALEFIGMMAALMALVGFAVYMILPAFPEMTRAMGLTNPNDIQFTVTCLYFGLALGQMVCGPLSDRFGRKPVMYFGLLIFAAGCVLAIFAQSLIVLLAAQVLQGAGLGAPRIVSIAMIRDQYAGREMARVLSFVLIVFTLVPTVAPGLGQIVIEWADWRAVYQVLLALTLVAFVWFAARQPETAIRLPPGQAVSPARFFQTLATIARNPITSGYTIITGLITSAFIGYLNLSQPILQELYGLGSDYPRFFAIFAISISAASFLNGRLVVRLGMQRLSGTALIIFTAAAFSYWLVVVAYAGQPPLWTLLVFLMIVLFCFGILVGNLNALALEPLGKVAGTGAAFVGALATILSLPLAIWIGGAYDGTSIAPLVLGFAVCGGLALVLFGWLNRAAGRAISS